MSEKMKYSGTLFLEWNDPLKPRLMLRANNGHKYPILNDDDLVIFKKETGEELVKLWEGSVRISTHKSTFSLFVGSFEKNFIVEMGIIENIDAEIMKRSFLEEVPAELHTKGEHAVWLDG
ncbi:MAG: hypothetical protein MUD00_03140 [Candidatus Pacebacteria bacterium]|jgi:hypothetical protein|nr:hypothetical protein [Candidatus Paceibacterota bacterium]